MQCWVKRDWPAYHAAVSAARRAQAIAFHHYHNSLFLKLKTGSNDRLWWKITKDISGLCKPKTRFAPDVGSASLATYFTNKLSLPTYFNLLPPTLSSEVLTVTCKKSWRIKLSKVRHVLSSLDVTKAKGPDNVSPHILKHCSKKFVCQCLFCLVRYIDLDNFQCHGNYHVLLLFIKRRAVLLIFTSTIGLLFFLFW